MELSRRNILAGMGAVGAAGAGAGLGTSALYFDEESFANNSITAGELDLKMDWEEHYSFPQIYSGIDDPTVEDGTDLNVLRTDPADVSGAPPADYVGLPDPDDPVVWVNEEDNPLNDGRSSLDIYFRNTVIEAFPDTSDSGNPPEADFTKMPADKAPCTVLADVPMDLGRFTGNNTIGRTDNPDTNDSGDALPLINLTDVKPGDFGELTLSTHLCDNDGYLWLGMPGGLDNMENGLEEPESSIGNDSSTGQGNGELPENVETVLWYDDDCSNIIDGDPDPLIGLILVDASGTISESDMDQIAAGGNELVEEINNRAVSEVQAGLMTFNSTDTGSPDAAVTLRNDVETVEPGSAYLDSSGNGEFEVQASNRSNTTLLPQSGQARTNTDLAPALDLAREVLNDRAQDAGLPNAQKTILVLTDGRPSAPARGVKYGLNDPGGSDVDANNGNGQDIGPTDQFVSDYFDGLLNNDVNSSVEDEVIQVARDIDTGSRSDTGNTSGTNATQQFAEITGGDSITIRSIGVDVTQGSLFENFLIDLSTGGSTDNFFNINDFSGLTGLASDVVDSFNITGPAEEVIFRGTLQELETQLSDQGPLPLDGNVGTAFDETGSPPDADDGRECFNASATHCFGFGWWVPEDVGNEIQGDSVGFDLQFIAEQCRNNDDPGQTVL
jgi:hypothetical protein